MERADSLEKKLAAAEDKLQKAQAELAKATEAAAANAKHEAILVERLKAATSTLAGEYTLLYYSSTRLLVVFCCILPSKSWVSFQLSTAKR